MSLLLRVILTQMATPAWLPKLPKQSFNVTASDLAVTAFGLFVGLEGISGLVTIIPACTIDEPSGGVLSSSI